ncbi:MAG: ABC transporter ATP-binding protein/permease [Clostridiales bacterium]|nr:ABC transporter ATP-binding protein/permease [Clostridiales bacterium]
MTQATSKLDMLFAFLKGSKRWFLLAVAALLGRALCTMLSPQAVQYTVDSIIGTEESALPAFVEGWLAGLGGREMLRENLWLVALAVAGLGLLSGLLRYLYVMLIAKGGEGFVRAMRNQTFRHIERLPFSWHMSHHTGDIIQRCTTDIELVKEFLSNQLSNLLNCIVTIVAALAFLFGENLPLALVALVTEPILLAYSILFRRKLGRQFQLCDEADGELSTIAQENLTGVRVVRAFGREEYERARFDRQSRRSTDLWVRFGVYMSAFFEGNMLLGGLQLLLVLTIGTVMAVHGQLTLGSLLAVLSYITLIQQPTRQMGRILSEMSKAGVSINRIYEIMSAQEERDPPEALTLPMNGDIVFDHVSFHYPNCPLLLEDITFTVPAGATLGILGTTGSGKSTLMHLLDRLYDLPEGCGTITIGGMDIAKMEASWVRRNVGMVLQEPMLFSRTLSENIGLAARGDCSLSDIREAARTACLEEAVDAFAHGYDTMVGERGVTLSGGQKQRAAIARMLLQKAPIMVFDDSLSAVDAETDAKIRAALQESMGSSTCILISHRISTLMAADQIIVLDKGRIVEQGTHETLLAQDGLYKQIYTLQAQWEEADSCG